MQNNQYDYQIEGGNNIPQPRQQQRLAASELNSYLSEKRLSEYPEAVSRGQVHT
jgi:hypothetical protein